MVPEVPRPEFGSVPHAATLVRVAVSLGSLTVLILGIIGKVFAIPNLTTTGLFLYAFVGFGSAILMLLGLNGWKLVAFSPPLGLTIVLIGGMVLVSTKNWADGPPVFWALVGLSVSAHLFVLFRSLFVTRGRHVAHERLYSDAISDSVAVAEPVDGVHGDLRGVQTLVVAATALGVVLCLTSALSIRHLDPGFHGLLGAISPAWYVGLTIVAIAIVAGQRAGKFFAGLPVVALQISLTGTSALVFEDPRYAWTAKQVGLTSYILVHGSVNPKIGFYQAWPGFFSGVAWLSRVSGLTSPLGVARWWSPVLDLATLLVFQQLASLIIRDPRRAWLATTIFVLVYTINDSDYFCPQSAAFILAIAIFAVVFRQRDERRRMSTPLWILLSAMSVAIAFTHPLTPYLVTGALLILVLFGRARTRWAPIFTLAPAVTWALLHLTYVEGYAPISQLGRVFHNLLTPGKASGGPTQSLLVEVSKYSQAGAIIFVGVIVLVVLVRDHSSLHVALALCALSGAGLIVANAYGNEADYRVVLFALPWLAIVAADFLPTIRPMSVIFWSVAVLLLLSTYLAADMGLDYVYAERPGDLLAVKAFEQRAPAGSSLIVIGYNGNFPEDITGRYNLVNEVAYSDVQDSKSSGSFNASKSYDRFMRLLLTTRRVVPYATRGNSYYVLTGQQPAAYLDAYNYATVREYREFSNQFAGSSQWRLVLRTSTAELFRLNRASLLKSP